MSSDPAPVLRRSPIPAATLATVVLLVASMVWGTTFFSQKDLITRVPILDLLGIRFALASVALLIIRPRALRMNRDNWIKCLVLSVVFIIGQATQLYGLDRTSASVSGFITGLFVVFTPLWSAVLFKTRIPRPIWVSVGLATIGLGVLSLHLDGGFRLGAGELLTLLSALMFGLNITLIGRWGTRENAMGIVVVQTLVAGVFFLALAVPNGIVFPTRIGDWAWICYYAFISGVAAFFAQVWAQTHMSATRAAVILTTEPLWAAVFAIWLGTDSLSLRLVGGAVLMFGAMIIASRTPEEHPSTVAVDGAPVTAPGVLDGSGTAVAPPDDNPVIEPPPPTDPPVQPSAAPPTTKFHR